jgi:hypothetical protein
MENELRAWIRKAILSEGLVEQPDYRCRNGKTVKFGCGACVFDLEARIDDATHRRNACSSGSADRSHYNGILFSLRRELNRARKIFDAC